MITSKYSIPSLQDALASALRPKGILPMLTFVLVLSMSTAWSYDDGRYNSNSDIDVSRETLQHYNEKPSSVPAEQCRPLLNTQAASNNSAKYRNQRAVGQMATLGIILGARFALEPKNETADLLTKNAYKNLLKDNDGKRTAHAIANYRDCRKQIALIRTAKENDV